MFIYIHLSIILKESNSINQNNKNKMQQFQAKELKIFMLMSKKRWIHALSYEGILLLIMTSVLSYMFEMPVELTGSLGLAMAIISVFWNMLYNNLFEKLEGYLKLQRSIWVRILHAIGFEGGLLFMSVPLIAYSLNLGFLNALLLDISITLCILVYTFIFQWCFDVIERKYSLGQT